MTANTLQAQSVGVKTDKKKILIGERLKYELMIDLPAPGYTINFNFPDSLIHFDVTENKNFDTLQNSGNLVVHKELFLTSFDSGSWYVPSFEVLLGRNNISKKYLTDSILVEVGYSPADSTNQLRDIKPIIDVEVKDYLWLYIAAIILGLLLLAYVMYKYFKNREKKPPPLFHSQVSPYEEAMKSLQQLKVTDLNTPDETKIFHTSLTFIFKRYISRKEGQNFMNQTTGDLLVVLNKYYNDTSIIAVASESLRCADAVKFAKYIPAKNESDNSLSNVTKVIEIIDKISSPEKPISAL